MTGILERLQDAAARVESARVDHLAAIEAAFHDLEWMDARVFRVWPASSRSYRAEIGDSLHVIEQWDEADSRVTAKARLPGLCVGPWCSEVVGFQRLVAHKRRGDRCGFTNRGEVTLLLKHDGYFVVSADVEPRRSEAEEITP